MITVIGAGPAGSYVSYLLAKQGKDVTLIEEHDQVGSPVQCTGIITDSLAKFVKLKRDTIANEMDTVKVISKNNTTYAKTKEIVMWRNKFDRQVADMAENAGVNLLTGHKFISLSKNSVKVKDKKHDKVKEIKTNTIIGADGPSSPVAKAAGIPHNNKFYIGMQAKVKHKCQTNVFQTHFGTDYPHFFGWVVPESEDTVRLGLGAKQNAQHYFNKFIEKVTGKKDILCWESGIIPIYNPNQIIQKNNVYLIGDAASQVKATTGGGIIPSCKAAHTLTDCIVNKKNYNRLYRWASGKELWLHLKLRNTLNKFTDKDYDKLLDVMNSKAIKSTLKKYDRDTPIPLLFNLAVKEPRLYSFLKFAF